MSDYSVDPVSNERLQEQVYELRDEYIKMKKMYEDLFYNLDYDNFSMYLKKDMDRFMLTFKEVYPDGTASESSIIQTAKEIRFTVSEIYDDVTARISIVSQTADKISWLVRDGTNASNFTLTSRTAALISDAINITGYVTFTSLKTPGETIIDGGNITAGTISGINLLGNNILSFQGIHGVQISGGNIYFLHYMSSSQYPVMGGIRYDDSGSGVGQARYRIFLYSLNGTAIKIQSSGNISIETPGTVYCYGNWVFAGPIQFANNVITFAYGVEPFVKQAAITTAINAHVMAWHV